MIVLIKLIYDTWILYKSPFKYFLIVNLVIVVSNTLTTESDGHWLEYCMLT